MPIFVGRARELKQLNSLIKKRVAQLVVIRGRRRIGKSRLAEEFGRSFPQTLIFSGLAPGGKVTAKMQREDFARQMANLLKIAVPAADDWGDLFRTLAQFISGKKLLLVLDEITWMGEKDPTFLSKLKSVWDSHFKKNPELVLIISGSISSWIEKNILSSTGFLGRISLDMVLKPLPLHDCNEFWGKQKERISAFEKLKVLSVTGGIPRYLEEIVPTLSAEEIIHELCFRESGLLFREFDNIFSDLFSKRSHIYQSIVELLVGGSKSLKEICDGLGKQKTGVISEYLNDLKTAGFISRDYTWHIKSGKVSKLSQYRLEDNYARFFLKYVRPNREKIRSGALRTLPAWDSIIGFQFENLILNNRHTLWDALNLDSQEIVFENPYFQTATKSARGCQIDYLVQTRFGSLYLCEIKFCREPQGMSVVHEVKEKIERLKIGKYSSVRPVLIHVNGVKPSVIESEFFAHIVDFSQFFLCSRNTARASSWG